MNSSDIGHWCQAGWFENIFIHRTDIRWIFFVFCTILLLVRVWGISSVWNTQTILSVTNNYTTVQATKITFPHFDIWLIEALDLYVYDFMHCTAATYLAWMNRCSAVQLLIKWWVNIYIHTLRLVGSHSNISLLLYRAWFELQGFWISVSMKYEFSYLYSRNISLCSGVIGFVFWSRKCRSEKAIKQNAIKK